MFPVNLSRLGLYDERERARETHFAFLVLGQFILDCLDSDIRSSLVRVAIYQARRCVSALLGEPSLCHNRLQLTNTAANTGESDFSTTVLFEQL